MSKGAWTAVIVIALVVIIGGVWVFTDKPAEEQTPPSTPSTTPDQQPGDQNTAGDDKPVPATGEPIKIGAILPLTGDAASYGQDCKAGMEIAVSTINSRGGIAGQPIKIVYEDSQADPKAAVSAYTQLVEVENVKIILGDMFSHTTQAIAPLAQEGRIVLISPTASAASIPETGNYIFTIYPSDKQDGEFIASYVLENTTYKSIAIIGVQQEAMLTAATAFKESLANASDVQIREEYFAPETTNIRSVITNAIKDSPDCILITCYLTEVVQILKQIKELGIKTQPIAISTAYDPALFELAGNAAQDLLISAPIFDVSSDNEQCRAFTTKYASIHNEEPNVWSAYGFDVVTIVANAIRLTRNSNRSLSDELLMVKDYNGLTGNTTFNSDGSVRKELRLMKVDNSSFREVDY